MFERQAHKSKIKNKTKSTIQWILLLIVVSVLFEIEYFISLDDRFNDHWRREIASKNLPDDSILIIEIDDKSLTEMESEVGRWPWPRTTHAFLVEGLVEAGAKVIVFDILFSERDLYRPDADEFFSETVSLKENVFFAATQLAKDSPVDAVSIDILPSDFFYYKNERNVASTKI